MPIVTLLRRDDSAKAAQHEPVTWIDIDIDDAEDQAWLASQTDLSERCKERLRRPAHVNRREVIDEGLIVSLRSSNVSQPSKTEHLVSIRILLGHTQIVTARSDRILAFEDVRSQLESGKGPSTQLEFLGFVAAGLAERLEGIIFDIIKVTDQLEDALLDGAVEGPMHHLSTLRRRIYGTRRLLTSLRHVLSIIDSDPSLELTKTESTTLRKSSEHVLHLLESLEDCRARAQLLQDQIEGRLSVAMARSSYNLAIVATVFLPLTFITGLLGMNVAGIPDAHNPWGFWTVCFLLSLIAGLSWLALTRRMRKQLATQY